MGHSIFIGDELGVRFEYLPLDNIQHDDAQRVLTVNELDEDDEQNIEDILSDENESNSVPSLEEEEEKHVRCLFDLVDAAQKVRARKWAQLATSDGIGGVHSGRVMLHLIEIGEDEGARQLYLVDSRHDKMYAGGQMYIPMTRKIIQKQSTTLIDDLPSLPAMIQSLLNPLVSTTTNNETALRNKVEICVKMLSNVFKTAAREVTKAHNSNSCRFEYFCYTRSGNEIQFPNLSYSRILVHSPKNIFMEQYNAITESCVKPLYRTFVTKSKVVKPADLTEQTKGMLTLCSELAVKLTEVFPFEGKLMTRVKQLNPAKQYQWFLPRHLMGNIPVVDSDATGLEFGLSPEVMQLNLKLSDLKTDRPLETDSNYHRLPVFIQMHSACLKLGVKHPITFLKAYLTICGWMWRTLDTRRARYSIQKKIDADKASKASRQRGSESDSESPDSNSDSNPTDEVETEIVETEPGSEEQLMPTSHEGLHLDNDSSSYDPMEDPRNDYKAPFRSVFLKPDFRELCKCPVTDMESMILRFCKIIANAYDYEWFMIFKDMIGRHFRKIHKVRNMQVPRSTPPVMKLHQFPTTVDELTKFRNVYMTEGAVVEVKVSDQYSNKDDAAYVYTAGKDTP